MGTHLRIDLRDADVRPGRVGPPMAVAQADAAFELAVAGAWPEAEAVIERLRGLLAVLCPDRPPVGDALAEMAAAVADRSTSGTLGASRLLSAALLLPGPAEGVEDEGEHEGFVLPGVIAA